MFNVSHSKVRTWRRCRFLYELKYVRKLRRKYKGRPQTVGSIIHEALEANYTGRSAEEVFKGYEKAIGKMFEEERLEYGLEGAVEECRKVYEGYLKYYHSDGLKYLGVELEFNENTGLEIAPGIQFIGKIDAVVQLPRDPDDEVWIFERKTCKRIPDERVRSTDVQAVLYWAFLPMIRRRVGRKLLRENWPVPAGVIWDYVRSSAPNEPHLNKNGSMSKRAIDSTWEVYKQGLLEAGLDPADYEDMRQSLEGSEDSFFRRIRLPFSETMRDQVVNDFVNTAIEMRELHGISKDRNLNYDCQRCEFYNLCQAELRGLDTDFMLKKDYEVRSDEKTEIESEGSPE